MGGRKLIYAVIGSPENILLNLDEFCRQYATTGWSSYYSEKQRSNL